MQRRNLIASSWLIALSGFGSAMIPSPAAAHTEGVEAADPATPSALLGLRSAANGYDATESALKAWREVFTGERETNPMMGDHAGASEHAGHMMHSNSATMQQ